MLRRGKVVPISTLLGKTITEITGAEVGGDEIKFVCSDGSEYLMYHEQDCCEGVDIDDICGDVSDLLNTPITLAEDVSNLLEDMPGKGEHVESHTWTWYKLGTVEGRVTIRWYGESNGYYSESVDFVETKPADEADKAEEKKEKTTTGNEMVDNLINGLGVMSETWVIVYKTFLNNGLTPADALIHTERMMRTVFESALNNGGK